MNATVHFPQRSYAFRSGALRCYVRLVREHFEDRPWGHWGDVRHGHVADPREVNLHANPVALVEDGEGSTYITLHATAGEAVDYHFGQEYPDDFRIEAIVDTRDGTAYDTIARPARIGATGSLTDTERLLIGLLVHEGTPCPYLIGYPSGERGGSHCDRGCYDEPGCDGYRYQWELQQHPELLAAVMLEMARRDVDEINYIARDPQHPLHAWLAKRDPSYTIPEP